MLPEEFEPAYMSDYEDREEIRLIASDYCEERREFAAASFLRSNLLDMVWCPAGTFTMGTRSSELYRYLDEDQVEVKLTQGFWLSKYPVTQEQWLDVMLTWESGGIDKSPITPVYNVSWDDAQAFCLNHTLIEQSAGRLPEDWVYQLPTEAQWEYACRAGSTACYSFGDDISKLGSFAWYRTNSKLKIHEVGQKEPNAWGLHDMHGNIWEWCRDVYTFRVPGGVDPFVLGEPDWRRVLRGGSQLSDPLELRSAARHFISHDLRLNNVGFRIALVRE